MSQHRRTTNQRPANKIHPSWSTIRHRRSLAEYPGRPEHAEKRDGYLKLDNKINDLHHPSGSAEALNVWTFLAALKQSWTQKRHANTTLGKKRKSY